MNKQIQDIAKRMYGLRDALDIPIDRIAEACNLTPAEYAAYETGEVDIPISVLQSVAKYCKVELTSLLFGQEPTVSGYYLTRSGLGTAMERSSAYKYQSLAAGFQHRKAEPFVVTVECKEEDCAMPLNSHKGQEFNYILEGSLMIHINGKELILNEGDSLYFDSAQPHGMKALHGKPCRFLAIIL